MARKKELSPADRFYLDSHLNNEVNELSLAVKNSVEVVKEYVDSRKVGMAQDADRLMGKKERNGQVIATVMTEGASQVGDDARKSTVRLNNPNIIYHPKGKK